MLSVIINYTDATEIKALTHLIDSAVSSHKPHICRGLLGEAMGQHRVLFSILKLIFNAVKRACFQPGLFFFSRALTRWRSAGSPIRRRLILIVST